MSQKSSRKAIVHEDKDKPHTDTPMKEMKKKMAANAEKEKQAAEKNAEKQTDKSTDKNAEKATEKTADKVSEKKAEKPADKSADKKADKPTDKSADKKADKPTDKSADKKADKPAEKISEPQVDKSKKEENGEGEKTTKEERRRPGSRSNGRPHNGDVTNGDGDDDLAMVVDDPDQDQDQDELFPELTYEESDVECFEPPTPEGAPSRSFTRRSQAKAARTPETPRPASDKQADKEASADEPKKSKEDAPPGTDRKLRSADSPKPDSKKAQEKLAESAKKSPQEATKDKIQESPKKSHESPKKSQEKVQESAKKQDSGSSGEEKKHDKEESRPEKESDTSEIEVEVMFEEGSQDVVGGSARKPDTNYSKSRVKVSPYRRSGRLADLTASSLLANYTGNNSTMEMDITETSFASAAEEAPPPLAESPYLSGLRAIRGRRSYKPLKEMALRHVGADRSARAAAAAAAASEAPARPTGTVVGRKRKPEGEEAQAEAEAEPPGAGGGKRARLLDRLARPFRRTLVAAPLPRRAPEIVGINTDLPLTAPVAAADTFDPETLKPSTAPAPAPTPGPAPAATPSTSAAAPAPPLAAPGPPLVAPVEDKRCIVM